MEERDNKGRFGKGNKGKPAGSKNKTMTRTRLAELIDNKWNNFEAELNTLKGKAFVEAFTKLLPFHLPQYSAINFSLKNMSDDDLQYLLIQIKQELKELKQ